MTRRGRRFNSGCVAVLLLALTAFDVHAGRVTSIRIHKSPEFTRVVFDVSEHVRYSVSTLPSPDRVVVDIAQTELAPGASIEAVSAGTAPITALRHAVQGGRDLRWTIELAGPAQPKAFVLDPAGPYGHRLVLDLYARPAATAAVRSSPRIVPPVAGPGVPVAVSVPSTPRVTTPARDTAAAPPVRQPAGVAAAPARDAASPVRPPGVAAAADATAKAEAAPAGPGVAMVGADRAPAGSSDRAALTSADRAAASSPARSAPASDDRSAATSADRLEQASVGRPTAASPDRTAPATVDRPALVSADRPAPPPVTASPVTAPPMTAPPMTAPTLTAPTVTPSTVAAAPSAKQPERAAGPGNSAVAQGRTAGRPQALAGPRGQAVVIAIDAGHGGEDPGAVGGSGVQEKDVVLAIARRLAELVNAEPGFRAVLIRDGDYYIPLALRPRKARDAGAHFFVSVHADAHTNRAASGASVYALSERGATSETAKWLAQRENNSDLVGGVSLDDKDKLLAEVLLDLSMTASLSESLEMGSHVLGNLRDVTKLHSRHVEQAGFRVLRSPDIPSILVETGYVSNAADAKQLESPGYRTEIASAIFAGVRAQAVARPPRGTVFAVRSRDQQLTAAAARDAASARAAGSAPAAAAADREHKVERGETLAVVAARFGVSARALRRLNGLVGDTVRAGQVLRIPQHEVMAQ